MSAIRNGLYDHLSGDATLTALLPNGSSGIFSDVERPSGVSLPCIQIGADTEFETITGDDMIQATRALLVMAERSGDQAAVDAIAARVRALFRGAGLAGLTFSGYRTGYVSVAGPVETDPDFETYGRVVGVTMRLIPE